jgi:mono/diheme cytochrome c family protein
MKKIKMLILSAGLSVSCLAADVDAAGKAAMKRECVACHSLRLVESQRLSATAWGKEIDKMMGWGAVVSDKQLLLDYLAAEYSDQRPVAAPDMSKNGANH